MIAETEAMALFDAALAGGADFAELFMEDREEVAVDYDGTASLSRVHGYGAGLYLLSGTQGAYVYFNDFSPNTLQRALSDALSLLQAEKKGQGHASRLQKSCRENPCPVRVYPSEVSEKKKIALLQDAHRLAVAEPGVAGCSLRFTERDQRVTILNSEGVHAEDRRVTTRMRFVPVVSAGAEKASTFTEFCAAAGMEAFEDGAHLQVLRSSISDLRGSLTAVEAPSCRIPVVLAGGSCSGTFFHEACGHQLETRSLQEGGIFWDRRGEEVASPRVTLVDDGTMPGMYGSSRFDDEGMPRQKNILIEKGILKGYMADRLGARRLNLPRTGSGRRQDYAHAPGPRMSNTYLAAGTDDEESMIRELPVGLYVTGIGGGTGGREFTLLASTAYLIRHGEIAERVKGAILVGRGDETMRKIDRVGKRFVKEEGGGSFCGADSGFIATTTSGPQMRISEMVVGGKGGSL